MRCFLSLIFAALFFLLSSCTTLPPSNPNNICDIFDQKGKWYKHARKAQKRWGSPIPTTMAFMHQESRFRAKAKPPRTKILWIFPGPRKSDAYGYAQVKDDTWEWYQKESGNSWGDRDEFDDAVDFVSWYNHISTKKLGIGPDDPYRLYLAYHEGHGGYKRGSYKKKPQLQKVARKVSARAATYRKQLATCEKRYQSSWWWPFS